MPIFSGLVDSCQGHLLFGCHDRKLYCLDDSGKLLWSVLHSSEVFATPFITGDRVVSISTDASLQVTRLQDGGRVNCFDLGSDADAFSSPVVCQDKLILGLRDDHVYCYQVN